MLDIWKGSLKLKSKVHEFGNSSMPMIMATKQFIGITWCCFEETTQWKSMLT